MGHGDEAGEPALDRGSFEGTADWYDRKMGERGDRTHQHVLLPALLRAAGDLAGTRALDLGCGGGLASRALAEAGARVVGLDLSRTLVGRALAREEVRPRGIGYLVADAARLPVRSASFDLVAAHM